LRPRRFYAKGQNCCAALRADADAACGASACPANTLTQRCADLLTAIAAPESAYPPALQDWTCNAFPNDDLPGDSLIVALISLAIAIPVTIFLGGFFEVANDSEAPESWLRYTGLGRFLCGRLAHRRWHYTGPLGQPPRFARWYIRSADAPLLESLTNAMFTIRRALACAPRALLAGGGAAKVSEQAGVNEPRDDAVALQRRNSLQLSINMLMNDTLETPPIDDASAAGNDVASRQRYNSLRLSISRLMSVEPDETASTRSASLKAVGDDASRVRYSSLQTSIRLLTDADELAAADAADAKAERAFRDSQYSISWGMRSHPLADDEKWDGDSSLGSASGLEPSHVDDAIRLRCRKRLLTLLGLASVAVIWAVFVWFILTYGLLIYDLMGLDAQRSFTRSWGVSYGVGAANEWRDVARQAAMAVAVVAIAERLHLTRPVSWLEDHVDYMSTSALLLEHGGLSFFQELRLLFTFRRRLSD
jgi:hypothetical protein